MSRSKKWSSGAARRRGAGARGRRAGARGTGRHVGGAVFVNVPAEMTGRWTRRPRPVRKPASCFPFTTEQLSQIAY